MKTLVLIFTGGAMISCGPKPSSVPTPPLAPPSASDRTHSDQIYREVNEYRKTRGKPPIARHAGLDRLALQHSKEMIQSKSGGRLAKSINHDGFQSRSFIGRQQFNLGSIHENVAAAPRGYSIVQTWTSASSHERAMRGKWSWTGVGAAVDKDGTVFATQIFANEAPTEMALQRRYDSF